MIERAGLSSASADFTDLTESGWAPERKRPVIEAPEKGWGVGGQYDASTHTDRVFAWQGHLVPSQAYRPPSIFDSSVTAPPQRAKPVTAPVMCPSCSWVGTADEYPLHSC